MTCKRCPEEQIEIMYNIFAPFISNVWTDADMNQIAESRKEQLRRFRNEQRNELTKSVQSNAKSKQD